MGGLGIRERGAVGIVDTVSVFKGLLRGYN